jgi:hypothetical protein
MQQLQGLGRIRRADYVIGLGTGETVVFSIGLC